MSGAQIVQFISAVSQLLSVLIWPAVVVFILVRFRRGLTEFFSNIGELSFKAPGMEATAKRRQVEAAAALGAAIAIRVPEGDAEPAARDPRDVVESLPSARAQRRLQDSRVLWVDDRPSNNYYEIQALEALGIEIDLSPSTENAVEIMRRRHYDLIISDMGRPPDMRAGYTLLDELRRAGDKTPFIIYSGSRAPEHVREAREHGAIGSTNSPRELITLVTKTIAEQWPDRKRS